MVRAMTKRQHFRRLKFLRERLKMFAKDAAYQMVQLHPGAERDALLKEARLAETASNIESWANSGGLQRPK